jgi:glycosyltransferase involved in cell wall biosynthesis
MVGPRILVDGYNLQFKQGTGIKTYTGLLQTALSSLGAKTSVLFQRAVTKTEDRLLREVAFHDDQIGFPSRSPLDKYVRLGQAWMRARLNSPPDIVEIPNRGIVVLPEQTKINADVLNGTGVFDLAFRRNLAVGNYLDITIPKSIDVFHLTFPIPIRIKAAKNIVTIHDIIPLRLPYTTMDNKTELLRRHRIAVKNADLIFTVSEFSKKDIVNVLDADPEKVMVTHQPSRFRPLVDEIDDQERVLSRFELRAQQYILFVGAIEPKKNLGRMLRAYIEADTEVPLVIVGPRAWMWKEEIGWFFDIIDKSLIKKVRFLNHVSIEDLRFIYSGARGLVFPSLYEGYGLPLVEAMAFGLPILTSQISSMPEVCGEAALYVDPFDVRDIRHKVEQLIGDQGLRRRLSEAGLKRTQQLTAQNFADQVAAGYRKLGFFG